MITPVAIILVPVIIMSFIDKGIVKVKLNTSSDSIISSSLIGMLMLAVVVLAENVANNDVEI